MRRGDALGLVNFLEPEGSESSPLTFLQCKAMLDVAMGGRVAEELHFGVDAITSGASSDIKQATNVARAMVTKWGYSDLIGKVYHPDSSSRFSGGESSDSTRSVVDSEVKRLVDASYERAKSLLVKYKVEHENLANALIEFESLTGDECRDIVLNNIMPVRGETQAGTVAAATATTITPALK